jgi:N-methylhydantoinase A
MRVGIDVGGTFTDLLAQDRAGQTVRVKVPSTPREPERAVLEALRRLIDMGAAPESIEFLGHSTTLATNALLGQVGLDLPRVALLTTEGFRDVLEIGRQQRSALYDPRVTRPRPLVPRGLRIGVRERVGADGGVVVALDPDSLAGVCALLERENVAIVAIAFLHAYAEPRHERLAREALLARLPDLEVILSGEVDPEHREYERTSTTVVHALLRPLVRGYLRALARGVAALGIPAPVYVMQSNGGMAALAAVAERPAVTIESGPAAGAIAAALLGGRLGYGRVISFDMGGTTAKAATIVDGRAEVVHEFEAAGRTHSGRAIKGSGYPVRVPFVDLAEVSAGGGTIARCDEAGSLRVGPLSAGADPGPAAYGRGDAATVTDANIVLGRSNPRALLGGTLPVDALRAAAAIDVLCTQTGLARLALAAGIVRLIDAEMAKVVRIVSVERGYDPRDFTLIAFGGAGPLHACAVATELGIGRIVVPGDPGLFSARGLLDADVRVSHVRSVLSPHSALDPAALEALFAELETRGAAELAAQGLAGGAVFIRELELRYAGQSFELTVPVRAPFDAEAARASAAAFHERHRAVYGFAAEGEPIEAVTARSTAVAALHRASVDGASAGTRADGATQPHEAVLERRDVVCNSGATVATPVYARDRLRPGARFAGPAIVEQYDATTFVDAGWSVTVDADRNLILEPEAKP